MAEPVHPVDPFSLTANPERYVPRAASERALAELSAAVERGEGAVVLLGPPGIGKTLLLRVLAERLSPRFRTAYLPYPALPPPAACRWALQALGEVVLEDAEAELLAYARGAAEAGAPVAVLVDDAGSMPAATLRRLVEIAAEARGALRLVFAALGDRSARPELEGIGAKAQWVALEAPMSREETEAYVNARLAAAGVSRELRDRFDARAIDRLHARSEGIPARVHEGATSLLRGRVDEAPGRAEPAGWKATEEPAPAEEADRARPGAERETPRASDALSPPPSPPVRPAPPAPGKAQAPASGPSREALRPPPRAPLRPARRRIAAWAGLAGGIVLGLLLWVALERGGGEVGDWLRSVRAEVGDSGGEGGAPGGAGLEGTARGDLEAPGIRAGGAAGPGGEPVRVNLNADPWAAVEVDGIDLGLTPLARVPLEPGRHVFRARMPDGRVVERQVVIGPTRRHVTFE